MSLEAYDYDLPEALIAQQPAPERDKSRLMRLRRDLPSCSHHLFSDLPSLLDPQSLFVLNNTKVIPARLRGRKPTGGVVELLLVEPLSEPGYWRCLGRATKGLKAGTTIGLDGAFQAVVRDRDREGQLVVSFDPPEIDTLLASHGEMPLPPYIRREGVGSDRDRYQTVYAREKGAVAAPTAGLHFTERLFRELAERGIQRCELTLHVGPGTFMPIRESIESHQMHEERFQISDAAAAQINAAKREGKPIVAVGTTAVRALEAAAESGLVRAGSGRTKLFIRPPHRFQIVDQLITNFHLPRSTLLLLVSALIGRERLMSAYNEAVQQGYRFYSYGDAMVLQ